MLSINTNISSLIAQSSMKTSSQLLNQAVERMSTGYKINHAKDNAANYSISTNMSTKISAYHVAEDNAAMGLDMVYTANETLNAIADKLSRLRSLTLTAQNGTYGEQSLNAIKAEAEAVSSEIERILNSADFNGKRLFGEPVLPTINGQKVVINADGFMLDVEKVDTTGYTAVASIVDESQAITGGQYTISSAQDLEKLMRISNNNSGAGISGAEFVLTNDIDMSSVDWSEWEPGLENFLFDNVVLNGNGYKIINAKAPIFWILTNSEIKNLGMGIDSSAFVHFANSPIAGLVNSEINNCYAIGKTGDGWFSAGIVSIMQDSRMDYCWSDVDVFNNAGGLAGGVIASGQGTNTISNSYSIGSVYGGQAGGIAAQFGGTIENCYTSSKLACDEGGKTFVIASNEESMFGSDCQDLVIKSVSYNTKANSGVDIYGGDLSRITASGLEELVPEALDTEFQVGIDGTSNSRIGFRCDISLNEAGTIANSILQAGTLEKIDEMLNSVSAKQTEFGAVQNRLESVLDEIAIQRDNLVSSRSTIRDADIAEVSSTYIQQQILQQAAATLMSTANQSPAIALQLI